MKPDSDSASRRPRKQTSKKLPLVAAGIFVLLFSVFFYFWVQGNHLNKTDSYKKSGVHEQEDQITGKNVAGSLGSTPSMTGGANNSPSGNQDNGTSSLQTAPNPASQPVNPPDAHSDTAANQLSPSDEIQNVPFHSSSKEPASGSSQDSYQNLISELNDFYIHLDKQDYMKAFALPEPSKVYFSKLIQKLLAHPPVVTRETDDLFTLLQNTAHFFRILGKNNIFILKGILDREKDSFEVILQSFYRLTERPEYLKNAYGIVVDPAALNDYAAFFLNTMGGRLYLFRRDSLSRLAVSYYSILVVDRAISQGDGRHGLDLRPAIDALIEELENGGDRLKLKETYLDTLYDLKLKYQR